MRKLMIGDQIVKSFSEGDEKRIILDKVSVEIDQGEFVAIMGPSGSGKSTLLFALSGLDEITSGHVLMNGRDLSELREKELSDLRRRKMGIVFQQPTMLHNLNILDNIILPSVRDNRKNVAAITQKAVSLMERIGIAGLEDRDISQVSGGQLQRAGICRALMNNPEILFADEPTGALNSTFAEGIMDIFSEINKEGIAILLVTHDAKVAVRAERILFMLDGKIVRELKLPKYKEGSRDNGSRIERITEQLREIGI
ncbi:ABC transporter ATP-binding protein [Sporosarcina sp. Te-1]|uniref:ABC transporter ATP-binding protein n=1 Tax=Sporosarcina sp. Te-1 TaxID=2818390 RepID=UPI001A9D21EB|nr:ABC transporter ATP-binding protein [Sporosarcina sp. Te-1]QTD41865.1 ABC transporter ATP-binding protein [Sporosarcina sp. Te-1]